MSLAAIVSNNGVISAFINNRQYTIQTDHPNYNSCLDAVNNNDVDAFLDNCEIPKCISAKSHGNIEVFEDRVTYKGTEIHGTVVDRMLSQLSKGYNIDNIVKFAENLMKNPSARSVRELYSFLANKGMPITEDGCFIGYKSVKRGQDGRLWDWHTGKVENTVGVDIIRMERNQVDDNAMNFCSFGYHVGSLNYAVNFHVGSNVVLIVKVNPADVVSVPNESAVINEKCRVTYYEVIGVYDGPLDDYIYRGDVNYDDGDNEENNYYDKVDEYDDEYDDEENDEDKYYF